MTTAVTRMGQTGLPDHSSRKLQTRKPGTGMTHVTTMGGREWQHVYGSCEIVLRPLQVMIPMNLNGKSRTSASANGP